MAKRLTGLLILVLVSIAASVVAQDAPPPVDQDVAAGAAVVTGGGDSGQTNGPDPLKAVGEALLLYLVLAVLLETALSPLFEWRVFAKRFSGRGFITPIKVVLAFAIIRLNMGLDVFKETIEIFRPDSDVSSQFATQFLTALLVAGGSSGVYEIFSKLGIRNPTQGPRKAVDEAARDLIQGANDLETEVNAYFSSTPPPAPLAPAILKTQLATTKQLVSDLEDKMKHPKA